MNLVNEIKNSFRNGNILYRLIFINIAVFVILGVWFVVLRLFTPGVTLDYLRVDFNNRFVQYLMIPSLPSELLSKPWTIITYMFTQTNLFHVLFNMLVLYWFGKIFLQYLSGNQLLSNYLLGGIFGALLYIIFINTFPGLRGYLGGDMLGASAAVMAIVVSISFYVPNYTIQMLFIGPVRLKYIAAAFILIDILLIASDNAGGNIAHLGGALYGFLFMYRLKKGKNTGAWVSSFVNKAAARFKRKPKLNVAYRKPSGKISDEDYNRGKVQQQKEIDRILDKIAKGGYESLSKGEKETLFKMSDKKF